MSLPKFIYVYEEQDRDGSSYFVATIDPSEKVEGRIGVYDLRETLTIRHKLQFRRAGAKSWFDSLK